MANDNPILNNPYLEPLLHYATYTTGTDKGSLDYTKVVNGRRIFVPETEGQVIPVKKKDNQTQMFDVNDLEPSYGQHIINLCRKEIAKWRAEKYPNTTRITKELLTFWFDNPERIVTKKLFFAQQEAVETAIWINEVADKSNAGQHILNLLRFAQQSVSELQADQLPRIAFKMATETITVDLTNTKGKTSKLILVEESENSPYFSAKIKTPATKMTVSYGLGYFRKSIIVGKR